MRAEESERPDLSLESKGAAKKFEFSKQTQNDALAVLQSVGLPTDVRATEAQMEEFYNIGYNMYRSGNFKDALPVFNIIAMGRPQEYKYIFAVGATYHMLKKYDEAIAFYVLAAILDPLNPTPHYHEADCWIHLQELSGAYMALFMGIKKATASSQYERILQRMTNSLKNLEVELSEKAKMGVVSFRGPGAKKELDEMAANLGDLAALESMLKEDEQK